MRRRGEQHHVDPAVDHLAVGIRPHELPAGRAVELFGRGCQQPRRRCDLIREDIAHRHQTHARVGLKSLNRRTGAATAAAHQSDAEPLLACGKESAGG